MTIHLLLQDKKNTFVNANAWFAQRQCNRLRHDTSLSVAIGIDLRVELLTQRRLVNVAAGRSVVVIWAGRVTGCTSPGVVLVVVSASGRSTSCTRNGTRLTLKAIVAGLATTESATLGFELWHAHCRKSRGCVVLGSVVVDLMDRDNSMNNVGLNHLTLDDRLDDFVDMMVAVLTSDHWSLGVRMLSLTLNTLVSESGSFLLEAGLDGGRVIVDVLAVLNGDGAVLMSLRQNLTILDGLDWGVVVVLVNFTINGTRHLLVQGFVDDLLGDGRCNGLVDGGVMATSFAPGITN